MHKYDNKTQTLADTNRANTRVQSNFWVVFVLYLSKAITINAYITNLIINTFPRSADRIFSFINFRTNPINKMSKLSLGTANHDKITSLIGTCASNLAISDWTHSPGFCVAIIDPNLLQKSPVFSLRRHFAYFGLIMRMRISPLN